MTFRQEFFRLYDRAISNGICSFMQTGIKKDDFTKLCTDPDFILDDDSIERACVAMKAGDEKKELLLALAREERR